MAEFYASPGGDYITLPSTNQSVGTPWSLVSERFDQTAQFADDAFGYTETYIQNIESLLLNLNEYDAPEISVTPPAITPLSIEIRPDMTALEIDIADWPINESVNPVLEELPDVPVVEIPDLTAIAPVVTDYNPPEEVLLSEPSPPTINPGISIPAPPDYELPTPPTLEDIFTPERPSVDIPLFEATLTIEDIPAPTTFNWNESAYNSDIWNSLLDKALDGIINGGGVLSAEVEQLIYDRTIERQRIANDKAFQQTEDYFSARGYDLPPGAMAGKLQEISTEILHAETNVNSDIAIDQAKRADENSRFFLQLGREMEVVLRDFHDKQEGRTLEAAKTIVTASIDIMNAHIQKQNIYTEVYKTHAIVYSERLRGALAHVELYKAELEGVKTEAGVQETKVSIYNAQINAVNAAANFYKTQLDGIKVQQEIESLKIDIYKAETDAYNAKMQGEAIKADIYKTKVNAERTKMEVYGEQVKAYIAQVEAKKTELQTRIASLEAVARKNEIELERYKTELESYNIEIQTKASQIDATVRAYEAETTAYNAETAALESYYRTKTHEIDAAIHEARFNLEQSVADIDAQTKSYLAIKELELKGTEGIMNVGAQLAASALSAVHASANYGYSGQESQSHGFHYNASVSESHSVPHDPPS